MPTSPKPAAGISRARWSWILSVSTGPSRPEISWAPVNADSR